MLGPLSAAANVRRTRQRWRRRLWGRRLWGASCPPPAAVPPEVSAGAPGGITSCGPFTKVVRDEARFAVCRKKAEALGSLTNPKAIYELIQGDVANETQEVFLVVGLDVNGVLLSYDEVARGQVDHVAVAPGDVLGIVLMNRCKAFVVVHNHPSGDARPSKDDATLTRAIRDAARPFAGLVLLDHVVVGRGQFYSFTEKKLTKVKGL